MINFEVDPAVLTSRLPPGTELDFFAGKTFVSLVGFLFETDACVWDSGAVPPEL